MKNRKMMKSILISAALIIFSSGCLSTKSGGKRKASGGVNNTPSTVSPNYGRYFTDNIVGKTGASNFNDSTDLSRYLDPEQKFISSSNFLRHSCTQGSLTVQNCIEVTKDENTSVTEFADRRFAYPMKTEEFLQIQTFANMRDITNRFFENLAFSYNLQFNILGYRSAHPNDLYTHSNYAFWNSGRTLKGYANCGVANNASYDPALSEVCMGHVEAPNKINVFMAEDPTITYHEMGHAFAKVLLNTRTIANTSVEVKTDLGYLSYDEAGAIGEGLSDYYSYYVNQRTHFAEWGLGLFLNASRPLAENDSQHIGGLEETATGRLSYPQFLNYESNRPELIIEDVHNAGQIMSHYLVAMTKDIAQTCSFSTTTAQNYVIHAISEAFAEMGDQSSQGYDGATESKVNLMSSQAAKWISTVTPINYRRFTQTFGRYILSTLSNIMYPVCNGTVYPQDNFEALTDSYGLLLFKTYNNDLNGITSGHSGSRTSVTSTNQVNSVLINKSFVKLEDRSGKSKAIIIDNRESVASTLQNLKDRGIITDASTLIDDQLRYNNNNGRISPGEIVGIIPALYNNSNTTMGGVQLLGNDWDHTKGGKPCNTFEDAWPSSSEGAADLTAGEGVQGGCNYITRYNGQNSVLEPNEYISPSCLVQITEDGVTKWATQSKLKTQLRLEDSLCLNPDNHHRDCFIRFIPGGDHAYYSKIDSKKTWAETMTSGSQTPEFKSSNSLFMEVSPNIPPGTVFNCRLRARFTNCEDCWHDSTNGNDDYLDYEFSGDKPYKIIHFKFEVVD